MNAVEIEEAVSNLAGAPFDAGEFPFLFLEAFGNNQTTIARLRKGGTNSSDVPGGVLQKNNIHIAVCEDGTTGTTLKALRESPKTVSAKVKFILATDGKVLEAEDMASGEPFVSPYTDFAEHFGFFLPLAGISTVREIKENPIDVRATSRLNKLYIALLKENPDWGTAERRNDMNHFMAKLIFCFFAEDTDIFNGTGLFTRTVEQMSASDSSNTHEVIAEIFRAMNIPTRHNGTLDGRHRTKACLKNWADTFPYVNGGLFSGENDVPRFSRIARTYLLRAGDLNWRDINPDIFGSMIQAIADEDERGSLGTHYTSVPNILKVLNPLFLDDLNKQLDEAGENKRMLLNLKKRISKIRVFDPACGSGNFLVIAYKKMREIEHEINKRRNESELASMIPLTNFRGIELRNFPAEIARLALIIAEYQCDVIYRGPKLALAAFLPLDAENWITCDNALRLDWFSICPPTGTSVKIIADDIFQQSHDQAKIDFQNEGGETYICGNPPYLGSTWQSSEQKADLQAIFAGRCKSWKSLDYVSGWFMKAADYGTKTNATAAFVSTNSICQGQQVPILWPLIFDTGHEIVFAHISFKWANLASHNAGVTVIIVGISNHSCGAKRIFSIADDGTPTLREVDKISAYLVPGNNIIVEKSSTPLNKLSEMSFGNKPVDGGYLLLSADEVIELNLTPEQHSRFVRRIYGSKEFIHGLCRYCLWIEEKYLDEAMNISLIKKRIDGVRSMRLASCDKGANKMAERAHQMREMNTGTNHTIVVPRVSSENRDYLPVGLLEGGTVIGDRNFAIYDGPIWNIALIASRLHWVWIGTICVRMRTDFSYSNTLGWNTFPVPLLTDQNKADLIHCAEEILLAREAHFPATIDELYDSNSMPNNLRCAHERNDEILERIYIGRRFKNNTERLEKLFDLYTQMIARAQPAKEKKGKKV